MSAHRHFDIDTGEEIFVPVGDCYRCELNRGEEADHQAEYIEELEKALRAIIALPDTPVEWMTSQEDSQAGFNEGLEVCRAIAREVLDER